MSRWDGEVAGLVVGRQAEGHYTRVACPACPERTGKEDHKESLSVNCDNGWWRCWKCDARGRLPGFDEEGEGGDRWWVAEEPEPLPAADLPEMHPLAGDTSLALTPYRDYLAGRGLPESVWEEAGLAAVVHGRYAGRVFVPVDPGELSRGFVARAIRPGFGPKYLCPKGMSRRQLFNAAALSRAGDGLLFAVEGSFDGLAHWPDAGAFLGKPTEEQINLLSRTQRPVVTVLDPDAWRESVGLCQRLRLRGLEAGCVIPPPGVDAALIPREILRAAGEDSLDRESPVRLLQHVSITT